MKVSKTLSNQIQEYGADGLQCAACSAAFISEMLSPHSTWSWWGAKCHVRGGLKTVAGSNFNHTFYICADCRRSAWNHARDASHLIPEGMWTKETVDDIFRIRCQGLAKTALYKALNVKPEEVIIYSVWVDED